MCFKMSLMFFIKKKLLKGTKWNNLIRQIEYTENCRKILHESCSKLGGKFMAKNSIIGCVPLLPIDNKPVYLYGKVVKPNFGLNWIPTECHTMDILSGDAGSSSNSDHVASYSAVVSIPCFGMDL